MSKKDDLRKINSSAPPTQDNTDYVYQNRRYLGLKETALYVVYDMSQSFNIETFKNRFVLNILLLDQKYKMIADSVITIWDIINDTFTGAIVDKTRTRWGKFKPYLMLLGVPGTILTCLFWLMPTFPYSSELSKLIFYLLLSFVREGISTFQTIARTGLQATLTPHPVDRTRLLTIANFASGFLGEKLPEQITSWLMDIIRVKVTDSALKAKAYKKLYVGMGTGTTIVSGIGALLFFIVAKERVMQSVETPSIKQGISAIVNNKPILLLTLSDMLNSFGISGNFKDDYFTEVLEFTSLGMITGIPGTFVHPIAYTLVPWFRQHFSSRVLYITGQYIGNLLLVPIFFIGSIGGMKKGLYKNLWVMGVSLAIWETVFMFFYGIRKVIPDELRNESMDYCEWKNGYRCESMISVAKGLASKSVRGLSQLFSDFIKKNVLHYNPELWALGLTQPDKTQFGLFTMYTLVPFLTSSLGIIPILFYDLTGKKRERMYAELLLRREEIAKEAATGDAETLAKAAQKQMEGSGGADL